MKGFPNIPSITGVFAQKEADSANPMGGSTGIAPMFLQSDDPTGITFDTGIPPAFSVPIAGGGVPFTRAMMNRLGYIATLGTFKAQLGMCPTFDPHLSNEIGGYPLGAILYWFQVRKHDGGALPSGCAWSGVLNEEKAIGNFKFDTNKECLQVYTGADNQYDGWEFCYLSNVSQVISLKEDNTEDFRFEGATGSLDRDSYNDSSQTGNGWALLTSLKKDFFPNLSEPLAESGGNLLFSKTSSQGYASELLTIQRGGWLCVRAVRQIDFSTVKTVNEFIKVSQLEVKIEIYNDYSNQVIVDVVKHFQTNSVCTELIPISAGYRVRFVITNGHADEMSLTAHVLPRVNRS